MRVHLVMAEVTEAAAVVALWYDEHCIVKLVPPEYSGT